MAEEQDNSVAKSDFKFSWDPGAASMGVLLLATYVGVKLGAELIRARTAIRIAEITTGQA